MSSTQDGAADARRPAIAVLVHERAAAFGLIREAVADAANAFSHAGGEPSRAAGGAYLPSGESLASWIEDQREVSPHWFTPPAVPASGTKAKVKVPKGATAAQKLAIANGDAPARLTP